HLSGPTGVARRRRAAQPEELVAPAESATAVVGPAVSGDRRADDRGTAAGADKGGRQGGGVREPPAAGRDAAAGDDEAESASFPDPATVQPGVADVLLFPRRPHGRLGLLGAGRA